MLENYVSPTNKVIDLMATLQFPFTHLPSGDTVVVATDTNMDPAIWQVVMGIVKQHGSEPVLIMYPPREYHQAEPPKPLVEAVKGAQWCILLTTTALAHSDFFEACKEHNVGTLLMEEATVDILTSPGCQLTQKDWDEIVERSRAIRKVWIEGGDVHVTSPAGTDLRAKLEAGTRRNADPGSVMFGEREGRRRGGTWPFGENRTTPLEGTGEGRIVWDICAHWPPGKFTQPVVVTVEKGQAVKFEGGSEARELKRYLDTYGDENIMNAPAEISLGTNHKGQVMGLVRNDKKVLGTSHIAIGRSDVGGLVYSNIHFDGLLSEPTITVNGRTFVKDGRLVDI